MSDSDVVKVLKRARKSALESDSRMWIGIHVHKAVSELFGKCDYTPLSSQGDLGQFWGDYFYSAPPARLRFIDAAIAYAKKHGM